MIVVFQTLFVLIGRFLTINLPSLSKQNHEKNHNHSVNLYSSLEVNTTFLLNINQGVEEAESIDVVVQPLS